jgi:flavin-dependent trigonelline monooxygenase, oxygenase component
MLRRACVYERDEDARIPIEASLRYGRHFETLFRNIGGVTNGFPAPADFAELANRSDYQPDAIRDSMVFGTPAEVIAKLKDYEAARVDQFCYSTSFGLPHPFARRSLELFISEVMPSFAHEAKDARQHAAKSSAR